MKEEIVNKMVQKQNSVENIKNIIIPIPNGFEVVEHSNDLSNEIMHAKKDNLLIQFLTDGVLLNEETFESRIQKIIDEIIKSNNKNKLYNPNFKYMMFLGDYNKNNIYAKIFVQDVLVNNDSFIRMANAYFVENKSKEFCQLSVSSGKYNIKKNNLLNNITNYQTDKIIKTELQILVGMLNRIKYKM